MRCKIKDHDLSDKMEPGSGQSCRQMQPQQCNQAEADQPRPNHHRIRHLHYQADIHHRHEENGRKRRGAQIKLHVMPKEIVRTVRAQGSICKADHVIALLCRHMLLTCNSWILGENPRFQNQQDAYHLLKGKERGKLLFSRSQS